MEFMIRLLRAYFSVSSNPHDTYRPVAISEAEKIENRSAKNLTERSNK